MAWMSKEDAAREMGISLSTLNRRIASGGVETRREGQRVMAWVELSETQADMSSESHDTPSEIHGVSGETQTDMALELAALRERCARYEELAEYRGRLLTETDATTQLLIAELAAAQRIAEAQARALPPAPQQSFPGERRRGLLGWLRRR